MSYSLNSLKRGGYLGDFSGESYRGYFGGYWEFRLQLRWRFSKNQHRCSSCRSAVYPAMAVAGLRYQEGSYAASLL